MNTPSNTSEPRFEEENVSTKYRQIADEKAPDHLNQQVLRRARHAAGRGEVGFGSLQWLRPLAFVAVVGLSLTVFLEINQSVDAVNPVTSLGQDNDSLDRAAEAALEQIRSAESLAQPNPGITDASTPPVMVDSANPSNVRREDISECSSEQRATTALWWQCIQTLERRGHAEAATREYETLFATYPAFETP